MFSWFYKLILKVTPIPISIVSILVVSNRNLQNNFVKYICDWWYSEEKDIFS